MADDAPSRQMSLIPYPYRNGDVVLRRGNAVVVYNEDSRQLSAHDDVDQTLELSECPYCHRPMRDDFDDDVQDHHVPAGAGMGGAPFVDPNYFAVLAESQRASPAGSAGPATPHARYTQPALRSGRSRDVSGTQAPPADAEFIGSEPSATGRKSISRSAFSPGFFKQFFEELRILGKGGNGVVMLVEHIMDRVSLGQFACKRIPVGDDHDWLAKVLVEVKLLQKIPHKNLVSYHWVWLEDYQPSKFGPKIPCLWILQEYCNGGDLHAYVLGPQSEHPNTNEKLKERARRRSRADMEPPIQGLHGPSRLTFDEIFSFFKDIAAGLHHLHSEGYIHRDLKPSNCLLQRDGSRWKVLISDFGEVQAAGAKRGSTGATGTISYCAPEVLQRDPADGEFGNFSIKSDIFSLGMIVYFMCFGRLPYSSADDINEENEDLDELRAEITKWPGFDDQTRARSDLPERLYRYLKRLLSVDPNERPSTDEILASIRGGSGLSDLVSPLVEENSARVSPLDSPRPRPSAPSRKQSTHMGTGRPGLSSLRQMSIDTLRARSPMERKSESPHQSHSRSRPTSPLDSSIIKRPRDFDRTHTGRESPPMPKSPQLALPPPPERSLVKRAVARVGSTPALQHGLRALLFLAKLISLMLPCSPYAANPWLLYPLLGLAAVEVGFTGFELRRALVFSGVHVTFLVLAFQYGRLCQWQSLQWEDL